jgi:membrane protein DedA with SNARE-associated domain
MTPFADLSPALAYGTVFFLLFMGAFGPTLPEEIVLLIAGYLLKKQGLDPLLMVGIAFAGILVSDNIIYGLGYWIGAPLLRFRIVHKFFSPRRQRWVRRLFFRYRFRLFFIGRYLYGLRPAILLFAGLTRVRWSVFFLYNGAAALVNSILWTGLGYLLARHIEAVMLWVRRGEVYILGTALLLIVYFVLEWFAVRRGWLDPESFLARLGAPYKIGSLVVLCVLLILVVRLIVR